MWHQHGGSGAAVPWAEALEMTLLDRDWLLERIDTQRSRETRALSKAARKG